LAIVHRLSFDFRLLVSASIFNTNLKCKNYALREKKYEKKDNSYDIKIFSVAISTSIGT
jgi:hypothetical protein